ncbi:hypothetical protein, partial [Anaerostipes faecalis]|uniref:hypothetical protein n=1 Tax=Anaerostipes faecalis TaxID=2738446 RepID=UPI003EFD9A1C
SMNSCSFFIPPKSEFPINEQSGQVRYQLPVSLNHEGLAPLCVPMCSSFNCFPLHIVHIRAERFLLHRKFKGISYVMKKGRFLCCKKSFLLPFNN